MLSLILLVLLLSALLRRRRFGGFFYGRPFMYGPRWGARCPMGCYPRHPMGGPFRCGGPGPYCRF